MKLLPGRRLVVAPNFHPSADWAGRLSLGAGIEHTAEGIFARPPWRQADEQERALLVLDPALQTPREELSNCLGLFVLPGHLLSAFWEMLAHPHEQGGISPEGFSAYVKEIGKFLAFKQLAAPAGAVFELVVNQPGQKTSLTNSSLWGLINLGEDAAPVVFVNIQKSKIPGLHYPPVRLDLAPGEGLRLPGELLLAGHTSELEQPEVLLRIQLPETATAISQTKPAPFR
jgi:hypothetical protein